MNVVAIVQARMGSTRLPNKVMKLINGKPMIELLLSRLSQAKLVNKIVVATTTDKKNMPLVEHVAGLGYACEQGSENDVLERYLQAARKHQADVIIRITGDCPLVDPALVDKTLQAFNSQQVDYLSNVAPATYPDGLDIEIFTLKALEQAIAETQAEFDHEHVTSYLRSSGKFTNASSVNEEDLSALRWTVDEPTDFEVITNVFNHFTPNIHFTWQQVYELQQQQPQLFSANHQIKRNEGITMGSGQKLWKRAKQIIPGGNMLLSKRTEMFLPEHWPTYFSKAKGCQVWDLDGKQYTDMCIMGIGTNTLGYGQEEVDAAVLETVKNGNMSSLNCPEEVYLAERLIEINPWAGMVRFARTGGEANAIAIRIARAFTKKDKVAVCGYHGWHDWYLSANLGTDNSLAGHLLPGLEPNGIPEAMRGTTLTFNYNNFEELLNLVNNHDVGVIKMEVERNMGPEDNFLQKVRDLASKRGIVLIFDECTSGFRETYGGIYQKYDVEPDIAMYSKALGNGYAISAIVGRTDIMQAAQTTFISSTFWTERIGPTAALKTLEIMERTKSWQTITQTGLDIRKQWQALADKYELGISHWGIPALTGFTLQSDNSLKYKTLITQEMLKKGYLASTSVYVCTEHTPDLVSTYFEQLDPIFKLIKECEEGRNIDALLEGPVCHAGFKRLN